MRCDDAPKTVSDGTEDQDDTEARELVVAEQDRRSTKLVEHVIERVRVDRGREPIADRGRPHRDPGLGSPRVRGQVVGQLGDEQDRVIGADRRRLPPADPCGDGLRRVRGPPAELRRLR